eukprot:TRINITY_DN18541_c0_g1_i1.p1 TRINITY_DN18541_c0_g1~~TRINITY_DN18541_c0_g1_i1.p1  ORF type:complete len:157 (-),score=56.21 TRINITY_DN18541_c0_g1_i1:1-471(-)
MSVEEAGDRVQAAVEEGFKSSVAVKGAVTAPLEEEEGIERVDERDLMIVHGPVRSGQQVYARDAPLVVMGNVSSGAEVMADGDVFVMGTLRGRVVAGMAGDSSARVFASRFQAELVCIGDTFCAGDALPQEVLDSDVACSVFTDGQRLHFSLANAY